MVAIDERTAAGVSFALTEEQTELRRLARAFAEREIRPHEAECDAEMRHPPK
jgi:alkylation response protein AidB-like acyl-CoA dehydrogenase